MAEDEKKSDSSHSLTHPFVLDLYHSVFYPSENIESGGKGETRGNTEDISFV